MERSLLTGALVMGLIGSGYGFLVLPKHQARGENSLPRASFGMAIGMMLLVFLATLPSRAPIFAAGQGWGRGFVLGGLGGLLAGWMALRCSVQTTARNTGQMAAVVVGPYALALLTTAIPLLWMRASLLDTLMGVAIGWLTVAFTLSTGLTDRDTAERPLLLPMLSGVGFALTLCAVAGLGEYRGTVLLMAAKGKVGWSALGMTIGAGVPFLLLLCALPASLFARIAANLPLAPFFARLTGPLFRSEEARQKIANAWRLLIGGALLLLLAKLLAARIIGQPPFVRVVGLGLLAGIVAWWVTAGRLRDHPSARWQSNALSALVVLAAIMAAYQMLAGFGVGLLLLAGWLVGGFATLSALSVEATTSPADIPENSVRSASELTRLLCFGVTLLLYRLFATRFDDDIHNAGLSDHYAVFGLLTGALLPLFLSGYLLSSSASSRWFRLIVTGALVLCVPGAILLLWGAKCALALLIGAALSVALPASAPTVQAESREDSISLAATQTGAMQGLFALAIACALAQWTHHALDLALLSRNEKKHLLIVAAIIVAVLALVADYGGRFLDWRKTRRQSAPQPVAKGAAQ